MSQSKEPIHSLLVAAIQSVAPVAERQNMVLEVLADPELGQWYSPYPEEVIENVQVLTQRLIALCPQGKMTVMVHPTVGSADTFRLEYYLELETVGLETNADFSLAVLETDNISGEVNLLGIDCPRPDAYLLGYEVHAALVKGRAVAATNPMQGFEAGANLRILVVDDNDVNLMVATKFLNRWGMRVDQAKNGQLAVNRYQMGHYDAVLMDLEMPVMDGFQAVAAIRKLEQERDAGRRTPIIALTAFAMGEARERAYAVGMNDFMPKPLDPPQLYQKLIQLTNRHAIQASA